MNPRWRSPIQSVYFLAWFTVLVLLAGLATISFIQIQAGIHAILDDNHRINQAGRQRMLLTHSAWVVELLHREPAGNREGHLASLESDIRDLAGYLEVLREEELVSASSPDRASLIADLVEYVEYLRKVQRGEFDPEILRRIQEMASSKGLVGRQNRYVQELQQIGDQDVERLEFLHQLYFIILCTTLLLAGVFVFRRMDRRILKESRDSREANEALARKARDLDDLVENLQTLRQQDHRRTRAMLSITEDLEMKRRVLELEMVQRDRAERLSEAAVESAPNGMLLINEAGNIVLVNSAIETLFGLPKDKLLDLPVESLIPDRFRQEHPRFRQEYFENATPRPIGIGRDLVGLRRDGTEFPVEVGLNPLSTDEGRFVLASVVDISERRESEARLATYQADLEAKNAELEEVLYIVSHDLKSPLVTIHGFAGMLRRHLDAEKFDRARDSAQRIQRAAGRMSELIDDLLQLSRVGRLEDEYVPVELDSIIEEVRETLAPQFRSSKARLVVEGPLPTLKFSPSRLRQIFLNLIGNALKYGCPEPGLEVTVSVEMTGEECRVSVQDQGPGIPPEYHDRIFLLFQRLDPHSEEGTGLGLAIVARILEFVKGRAWVESEPGKGATFRVAFPADLILKP